MATPDTSSQAGSDPVLNTLTRSNTDNSNRCCICYEDEGEGTAEPVVRPCTCSLPVHETCLLRWYEAKQKERNREENQRESTRDGVSCPQCKALFKVEEPFDFVVALRDTIHCQFNKVSPLILASMAVSGTFASSATYGVVAASWFAGYEAALGWVGLQITSGQAVAVPVARSAQVGRIMMRLWSMSSIAPVVVLGRAVPFLTNFFLVPISAVYGLVLIAQDDLPTWPPSPTWAMVMMPYIHMSYTRFYNHWLWPIDNRLNRALRGLETSLQPTVSAAGESAAENNHGNENQDRESRFILSDILDLGRTAWIILTNPAEEGGAELDLRIEIGANAVNGNDGPDYDDFLEVHPPGPYDNENLVPLIDGPVGPVLGGGPQSPVNVQSQPASPEVAVAQAAEAEAHTPTPVVPAPAVAAPPPQPAARERNNDQDSVELPPFSFTELINNVVTSLLFPFISYGMGELLRLSLPRSWTSPPKPISTSGFFRDAKIMQGGPGGLLQQRWGRSLAGGCLFVVIRDVFELYAKYRNVQMKKGRRIVRKRGGGAEMSDRRAAGAGAGTGTGTGNQ